MPSATADAIENSVTQIQNVLSGLPTPSADDSPRTINAWQNIYGALLGATDIIAKSHPDFPAIFAAVDEEGDSMDVDGDAVPTNDEEDRTMTGEREGSEQNEDEDTRPRTAAQKKVRHFHFLWLRNIEAQFSGPTRAKDSFESTETSRKYHRGREQSSGLAGRVDAAYNHTGADNA